MIGNTLAPAATKFKNKYYEIAFLCLCLIGVILVAAYNCSTKYDVYANTWNLVFNTYYEKVNVSTNVMNGFSFLNESLQKEPKIFCIILTKEDSLETKAKLAYETWANKCDNFKFVTKIPKGIKEKNKRSLNQTAEFDYMFKIMQPPGFVNESYNKLTDKVYLTLKYLYTKYDNYDWYLKSDDDTIIFVDNLRKFLIDKNSSRPVTYGYDFKVVVEGGYHSGGAGYVLSNEAFRRIGKTLNTNYSFCHNSGFEDVDVAGCLRRLGVNMDTSIDEKGRERFHPFSFLNHFLGNTPEGLISYAANPVKKGAECCSDTSISFHYMYADEIRKLTSLISQLNKGSLIIPANYSYFEYIGSIMTSKQKT